jgi:hypothetical protein
MMAKNLNAEGAKLFAKPANKGRGEISLHSI